MQLRLTPAVLAEMSETIKDAMAGKGNDPTDATYRKIHLAALAAAPKARGILVEVDEQDLLELRGRAEFNVGPNGVCMENLGWSTDPADKGYWLGRMRAYKGLLSQIQAAETKPEKEDALQRVKAHEKDLIEVIEFADSFEIEAFASESRLLLTDVLGLAADECFISDLSQLSDFCHCGNGYAPAQNWESWVTEKIRLRFGIQAETQDTLLQICQKIRNDGLRGAGLN